MNKKVKIVKVSDPENWYQQNEVEVGLYVTLPYHGRVWVRVFVSTIDDFAVSLDCEVGETNTNEIKWIYNHYETFIFDRMPEVVSLEWFYEHGFLPA